MTVHAIAVCDWQVRRTQTEQKQRSAETVARSARAELPCEIVVGRKKLKQIIMILNL